MTTDTRPSIAELQQKDAAGYVREVYDAVPVLLEIAAAAMAAEEAREQCDALSARWMEEGGDYEPIARSHARIDETVRARREALGKVRR